MCNGLLLTKLLIVLLCCVVVFGLRWFTNGLIQTAKVSMVLQISVHTSNNVVSECLDFWSATGEIGEVIIVSNSNLNIQLLQMISSHRKAKKIRVVTENQQLDLNFLAQIFFDCKFANILLINVPIKFKQGFFSIYQLQRATFFWHPCGVLYAKQSAFAQIQPSAFPRENNNIITSLYFSLIRYGQVTPLLIQSNSFIKLSRGNHDCQEQSDILAFQSILNRSFFNATTSRFIQSSSNLLLSQYATLLARPAGSNMVLHAKQGLGNRMRALLTASTIAATCNLTLTLVWEKDEHMGALFQELFKRPEQVASVFHIFDQRLLHLPRFKIYNYMEWELTGHKNVPIECPKDHDVYVKSAFSLVGPSNLRDSFSSTLFQPASAVRQLIQSVPLDTLRKCVGVHIRMQTIKGGDLHNIHGKEADAMSEANRYRRACHFSHFVKVMKEKFPLGACFFVSIDVRKHLLKIIEDMGPYRQAMFLPTNSLLVDRTKRSVQFALANMFLLSRTKYLLTSHWSSFSEMAVKLGSLPSENACSLV